MVGVFEGTRDLSGSRAGRRRVGRESIEGSHRIAYNQQHAGIGRHLVSSTDT